jgi:hypothetical protein
MGQNTDQYITNGGQHGTAPPSGNGGTAGPTRGLTLRDAAEALGISKEAVRKRVKRGTLRSAKGEDGRVYVQVDDLPAGGDAGVDGGSGRDRRQDHAVGHVVDQDGHQIDDLHRDQDRDVRRGVERDRRDDLIAELRAEVAAWREESRRKDHIIAGLVERLPPQLEAPASPVPRDAPETVAEDAGGSESHPATEGPHEAAEPRSWWRRWFGF